jgi:thiol-disulfide isomerase/thioredoxin
MIAMRRPLHFLLLLSAAAQSRAETRAGTLWTELAAKRALLPSFHQEFDVSEVSKTLSGSSQPRKWRLSVDIAPGKWRERSVIGFGFETRIFDGENLYLMDEDLREYTRARHKAKDSEPAPAPYTLGAADWLKAAEVQRRACGLPGKDHECAVLEAPLKPWVHGFRSGRPTRMLEGVARIVVDTETGLLITAQSIEKIETGTAQRQATTTYSLKRVTFGGSADASLFQLPWGNLREVRELSRWYTSEIRKHMTGKPAPEFAVSDLKGTHLALSDWKGRIVLLDFWATWCGPCREDAPALETLYRSYGRNDLVIVGVSVNEARETVERFLIQHPHSYPTVLSLENEFMPPYRIYSLPTYIVIDRHGLVSTAVHGDQGLSELRKLLRSAGLESQ